MERLPEHPRARSSGYVFQHIIVMEQSLGRHLLPETVHHRSGVRDDDRLGTLGPAAT